jgi:hypothetical protein
MESSPREQVLQNVTAFVSGIRQAMDAARTKEAVR